MNHEPLHHLVYVSSATSLFRLPDLVGLLEQARELNARAGISGLLLYRDGAFLQVLEGAREAVHATYARIRADARHDRVVTLLDEPLAGREFADWRMGFVSLEDPAVLAQPDVSGFLTEPLSHAALSREPSRALRLLLLFKRRG